MCLIIRISNSDDLKLEMKFKEMIIHQNNHSLTYFSLAPKLIKYYRRGNFFSIVLAAYNCPIHFKHDMMIPVKVKYKIENVVWYKKVYNLTA